MSAETPETGAPEEIITDELAAAREEIVALTAERDAERDRAMRMAAEAENTRRRLERDKADAVQFAAAKFARDILAVGDNLARAIDALPEGESPLRTGIEATHRELLAIFERNGITRVPSIGLPLDPNTHQAMVEVESDQEPGTVVAELQAGYMLKERLLRPALVTVAKAPSA